MHSSTWWEQKNLFFCCVENSPQNVNCIPLQRKSTKFEVYEAQYQCQIRCVEPEDEMPNILISVIFSQSIRFFVSVGAEIIKRLIVRSGPGTRGVQQNRSSDSSLDSSAGFGKNLPLPHARVRVVCCHGCIWIRLF